MMQEDFIDQNLVTTLKEKLGGQLPGMEAHIHMAPAQRFNDKARYEPNANTRKGGVLILLYPDTNNLYLPLILRPIDSSVHSGQVALPGGKKDQEDQDIIDTALRETWEEIGVKVDRSQVIGQLSPMFIPPSNFLVYPTVAAIDHLPEFEPSPHEVAQLIRLNLPDFISNDNRKIKEIQTKYMKAKVPCYEVGEYTIWGATAMILSEFLMVIKSLK